jgi:hypothetical protein
MNLWSKSDEIEFFKASLRRFTSPEKLFYFSNSSYYAYLPKNVDKINQTLQSRNSLIGSFTEKWAKDLFAPIAKKMGLYALNGVICDSIGLNSKSSADLALCSTNTIHQNPDTIKMIFEIKMSIVSNYEYSNNEILYIGDYKSHTGTPSLLRSDSMLKAIGKSLNIRIANRKASPIPIIVLGNSPIQESYVTKVDHLKTSGVIQGFWSINPHPCNSREFVQETPNSGFVTFVTVNDLYNKVQELLSANLYYFSSMLPKKNLGRIIHISNQEKSYLLKAEKFLELLDKEII